LQKAKKFQRKNLSWNAPKYSTLGVHSDGSARRNDTFWVTVGAGARLADIAAAAGNAEAFHVSAIDELRETLCRALPVVRNGRSAVVDVAIERVSSQVLAQKRKDKAATAYDRPSGRFCRDRDAR
jgi:acetolactate synthase-1/2/3 large subunit